MLVDMHLISVPADGDCLYHAFILGLSKDGHFASLNPSQLREYVANKILQDRDLYDDLVREWVDFNVISDVQDMTPTLAANRIRHTKEWATSTVIHILALGFHVRVVVFQTIRGNYYSEAFPSEWKVPAKTHEPYKTIFLLRRGYHFDLLEPLDDDSLSQYAIKPKEKIKQMTNDIIENTGRTPESSLDFHERRIQHWGGGGGIDALNAFDEQYMSQFGLSSIIGSLVILVIMSLI